MTLAGFSQRGSHISAGKKCILHQELQTYQQSCWTHRALSYAMNPAEHPQLASDCQPYQSYKTKRRFAKNKKLNAALFLNAS